MQPLQSPQTLVSLSELKVQIEKKLGPERTKWYFSYLNRFFTKKLSKSDFDKLCFRTIGRDNLPLHNQLIRAILKNTVDGKVPPPVAAPIAEKEVLGVGVMPKLLPGGGKRNLVSEDVNHQQCGPSSHPNSFVWSNGKVLPPSPRKVRTGFRDRKNIRDRPSPLGPNGKIEYIPNVSTSTGEDGVKAIIENGNSSMCDFQRPLHHDHYQGLAEQHDNEANALFQRPTKRPRTKKSPEDLVSLHSIEGRIEQPIPVEDEETVGRGPAARGEGFVGTESPLRAPLGIPFCLASIGGAHRVLPTANPRDFTYIYDVGELFDTDTLKRRMQQIVEMQGLHGVSSDCANLLNNGLDMYLKRLIRSCTDLVGSRSGHQPTKYPHQKQLTQGKPPNGLWSCSQSAVHCNSGSADDIQEQRSHCPVSMSDFKVAMELDPQQLGEHWPLLLEKICTQSCEE